MPTVTVTSRNLEALITEHELVILDWWAEWCAPCHAFAPVFEAASERWPDVVFGKVNSEGEPGLSKIFDVRSIPTTMVFRDRVLVFRQSGALPGASLDALLQQVRDLDMEHIRHEMEREQGS